MNLPHSYWKLLFPTPPHDKWAYNRKRIHAKFLQANVGDDVRLCRMPLTEMDRDLLLEAAYILASTAW